MIYNSKGRLKTVGHSVHLYSVHTSLMLGIEPRVLCMLSKNSTTEAHPYPHYILKTTYFGWWGLETESCYEIQAGLDLTAILLLQSPTSWDSRHGPHHAWLSLKSYIAQSGLKIVILLCQPLTVLGL